MPEQDASETSSSKRSNKSKSLKSCSADENSVSEQLLHHRSGQANPSTTRPELCACGGFSQKLRVPTVMENQIEEKMETEMETRIYRGL